MYHPTDKHIEDCILFRPAIEPKMVLVKVTLQPFFGAVVMYPS